MAWAGISGCAVIFVAGFVSQASPASAQTFDSYRCSDGTHFILAYEIAHHLIDTERRRVDRRREGAGISTDCERAD